MRIKMCSIHVTDPASAHAFYTETLGFDTLMAMPEGNLFIVTSPDSGGVGLLLEPSDNPIGETYRTSVYDAGMPAIVLGSPDVRADYERLTAAGVAFRASTWVRSSARESNAAPMSAIRERRISAEIPLPR